MHFGCLAKFIFEIAAPRRRILFETFCHSKKAIEEILILYRLWGLGGPHLSQAKARFAILGIIKDHRSCDVANRQPAKYLCDMREAPKVGLAGNGGQPCELALDKLADEVVDRHRKAGRL